MTWQERYQHFRGGLSEALDARLFTIEYLDQLVAEGRALLWFSENAAIAAEIKTYPTGAKVIHGLCAAGDLQEITDELIPQANAWGRVQGCIGSLIESRAGWQRQLKKHGYELHQIGVWKGL